MTFDEQHELERVRHANAQALETFKADRALFAERSLSLQRAVLEYAQIMVRSVILANGATSTAIVAFLGNVARNGQQADVVKPLGLAAAIAAIGVGFGVYATMLAYFSQWQRLRVQYEIGEAAAPTPQRTRTWALNCVTASLTCFLVAVGVAIWSFASADL